MKKLAKGLVLLITVVFLFSFFGCGTAMENGNGTASEKDQSTITQDTSDGSAEKAKEPVNVTFFIPGTTTEAVLHNPVFDEIYKQTGCVWDFTQSIGVTDYATKLGVLLASGDIPDIIDAVDGQALLKVIKAGVVRGDLDALVEEYGPNILRYTKKALAISKLLRSNDTGKLYGFINDVSNASNMSPLYPSGLYVRWDLYKQLGSPKLQTEDDYLKLVADMQKLEPKNAAGKKNYGFGFSFKWQGSHMMLGDYPYEQFAGIYFATWENNVDIRDDKKFIPRISADSVFVKEMGFWNKAWRMGLVDPESITMDSEAVTQKVTDMRYLAAAGWIDGNMDKAFIVNGMPEKGMAPVIVEDLVSKDALDMGDRLTAGGSRTFVVTKACKNPDKVVKMIDFLCSPEGAVLQKFGIEGQHWDIRDGKGVIRDEVIEGFKNDPDYGKKTGIRYFNVVFLDPSGLKIKDNIDAGFNEDINYLKKSMNQVQNEYTHAYGIKIPSEIYTKRAPITSWDPWACNIMTLPDNLAPKEQKIMTYLDATVPKVVFSKSETDYAANLKKMLDDLKGMGWDECSAYHEKDYAEVQTKFDKIYGEIGN